MSFRLLTRVDVQSTAEITRGWFIHDLVPEGCTTIIFGAPGDGKSTACLAMAVALQNGIPLSEDPYLGGDRVGEIVNVAWLSFEDDWRGEIYERLRRYPEDLDWPLLVDSNSGAGGIELTSLKVDGTNGLSAFGGIAAHVEHAWVDLGLVLQSHNVQVLFIDTLSDLVGTDASPRLVTEFFGILEKMRNRYLVTTILIGHASSHPDERGQKKKELLGATAWQAKARHVVLMAGNESKNWLRVIKSNRGSKGRNVTLAPVDGGPITVLDIRSGEDYKAERETSRQKRDWEKQRERAKILREWGPEDWKSLDAMGTCLGGSRRLGDSLVKGRFFERVSGGYQPVDAVIDMDWDAWRAAQGK